MATENMAQKIKELRQAKKLTLEQVANVVGVGKSTVRKWETGMIANMKRDKIAALAQALDTTPAYLMGWSENTKKQENNDNLAKLINRIKTDEKFANNVKLLSELSPERYDSITQLLTTLSK